MNRIVLHENWQMRDRQQEEWIPAVVPGSVYSDLLRNNRMEDPYYRDQEEKALALPSTACQRLCQDV